MKAKKRGISILVLMLILFAISIVVIAAFGKEYTVKLDGYNDTLVEDLNIEFEGDASCVKLVDKKIEDDVLKLKFESVHSSKTSVYVYDKDKNLRDGFKLYVHNFGTITYEYYWGESTGSIIIPITLIILLCYIWIIIFLTYKDSVKENMYQYKNIAYIGLLIFLFFAIINQIISLLRSNGVLQMISNVLRMSSGFSMILLPITFLISAIVTISNIVLIIKEGFKLKNLLGLLMGVFFCVASLIPEIINQLSYSTNWIDVHQETSIARFVQEFIEVAIAALVVYLECLLLGTIFMGVKSANHVPKYDKDYIIILGCQVRKNGKLTNLLKSRVDRALKFAKNQKEKTGKDICFVPSGGQGTDEVISESQAMKNYLLESGIEDNKILLEDKSKNTFENIKNSNEIIINNKKDAKVAFSTTNYHVFRAGVTASEQGIKMEGMGADTKSYFWINAFVREFIATLFSGMKNHIILILVLWFNIFLMIIAEYFSISA